MANILRLSRKIEATDMIVLLLKTGSETTTLKFTLDSLSLGRAKDNNIILNDRKVSRMHAKIERIGATYQIRDLESGNGTWVNGRKIDFHPLSLGDEIRIGDSFLIVKSFNEEDEAPTSEPRPEVLEKPPVPLARKLQVKDKIDQVRNPASPASSDRPEGPSKTADSPSPGPEAPPGSPPSTPP